MRSLAAAMLLTVSSWTLGRLALRKLEWPALCGYERVALRLTAGLGLTALTLCVFAVSGSFTAGAAAVVVLAVAGLVIAARDAHGWRLRPTPPISDALLVAFLIGAAVCAIGAVAPVTDDDALSYVVPIAQHIARDGALHVWSDQARSMWPPSQDLLLAFVLQVGGDRLGIVTALEWLLCLGVVSAMARRVCERREHVAGALVIALGAPVLAFLVASAKEDLLLLAATAAAGFCLAGDGGIAELAAAGLFAGIAAGAKYPGAMIAGAAVLWPLVRRGRHPTRDAALIGVCAAASGGLSYAMNLWHYANPVAPFVLGARSTPLDASAVRDFVDGYSAGQGIIAFLIAPFRIFVDPSIFGGRLNLYNPLAYAGVAALFAAPARRRNAPLFFLAAVLYTGWFFSVQNARLLLPAVVLLAPAAADVLVPLALRRRSFTALAALTAAASFVIVPAVAGLRAVRYLRNPAGFLERETQNYADLMWMNAHLDPRHDRVGSDHKVLAYLDIPWMFLGTTYQIEIGDAELHDPERLLQACRRQGITHLFGNIESFPGLRAHLRIVYRNPSSRLGGMRFFREPPAEETAVFVLE